MSVEKHFMRGALAALTIGLVVVGYRQTGARADGVPVDNPMTYSGSLIEGGEPVTGTRNIQLTVWDHPAELGSSHIRCISNAPAANVTEGRFQVPLDSTCTDAVHATADLWLEVTVGGTSLGRTKIAAVPFAVEAGRAADLSPAARNLLVPPGTIVAFGGPNPPTGWLICDGAAVGRAQYVDLFAAIGTSHGGGDGATTFNLPDLRGRFLRGVDSGAGNDPDVGDRLAAQVGGNVGDAVGSVQDFASALPTTNPFSALVAGNHQHSITVSVATAPTGGAFYTPNLNNPSGPSPFPSTAVAGDHSHSIGGGDAESRPINASVNWIIKR